MIAKLEQKVLIYGFTITQLVILAGIAFAYLMVFQFAIGIFGLVVSMVLGLTIVGIPAAIFRLFHVFPENYFENLAYYHFRKPDIYLPGREAKNAK